MITYLKKLLEQTLQDSGDSYQIQTRIVSGLYGLIGLIMFILNIYMGSITLIIITGSIALVGLSSFLYVKITGHYEVIRGIVTVTFLLGIIYFLYSGSGEGMTPFWALLLPFMGYFLHGLKNGMTISLTYLAVACVMLWSPVGGLLAYDYSVTFRLRFPVLYFSCFMAATGTDYIRHMTRNKLVETVAFLESVTWEDVLTGIENRRAFEKRLEEMWELFAGNENYISILLIDIDFFKKYNDAYGHIKGDEALKKVAGVLSKIVTQDKGYLARWGGEEFVCLLPFHDSNQSIRLGKKILKAIVEARIIHGFTEVDSNYLTVSIGTATVNATNGIDPKDVLKGADDSLYEAKRYGRNRLGRNREYGK